MKLPIIRFCIFKRESFVFVFQKISLLDCVQDTVKFRPNLPMKLQEMLGFRTLTNKKNFQLSRSMLFAAIDIFYYFRWGEHSSAHLKNFMYYARTYTVSYQGMSFANYEFIMN